MVCGPLPCLRCTNLPVVCGACACAWGCACSLCPAFVCRALPSRTYSTASIISLLLPALLPLHHPLSSHLVYLTTGLISLLAPDRREILCWSFFQVAVHSFNTPSLAITLSSQPPQTNLTSNSAATVFVNRTSSTISDNTTQRSLSLILYKSFFTDILQRNSPSKPL